MRSKICSHLLFLSNGRIHPLRPSFYTIKPLIENVGSGTYICLKSDLYNITFPLDSYNLDLCRPAPLILFCKGNAVSSNVKYLFQEIFL